MSQQNFPGQFPVTAPDIAVTQSPGGLIVDADDLMTETTTEIQNLQQDLTNRLIELPGSNLDFPTPAQRGVGIMTYLSATTLKLAGLPARIDAEFVQDPRVTESHTTMAQQPDGSFQLSSQVAALGSVFGLAWSWSSTGLFPLPMA